MIFIVGAPRSGTTWLQALLGAHPGIVTGQESHLFSDYVRPLCTTWKDQVDLLGESRNRREGLVSYLSQDEFDDLVRHFVRTVFSRLEGAKPEARFVLEKTPDNTLCVELISYYLPNARFIHMIRDGRDVAVSLMQIPSSWGSGWAPRNISDAARYWEKYVRAGQRAANLGESYVEVRYENLISNGVVELRRLFTCLGLECSETQAADIYESNRFEKLARAGTEPEAIVRRGEVLRGTHTRPKEPLGFYRKGIVGDWRNRLSVLDRQLFYLQAGDLLCELGYASERDVGPASSMAHLIDAAFGPDWSFRRVVRSSMKHMVGKA